MSLRGGLSSRHLSLGTVYHLCMKRTTVDIAKARQLATQRKRQRSAPLDPEPLPLLRHPVPVADIDFDDTSLLWEIEDSLVFSDDEV